MTTDTQEKKIWFIDSNVVAHWALANGGVLSRIAEMFELDPGFIGNYEMRYSDSSHFIDEILTMSRQITDELFISSLALNELLAAVRDELRSVMLFLEGVPLSKWRNPFHNLDIDDEIYEEVYKAVLMSLDDLFRCEVIQPMEESQLHDNKEYLDVYSSILFLIKQMQTQDAILLTTAIFHRGDYFVTKDKRLLKDARNRMNKHFSLKLVNPRSAIGTMRMRFPPTIIKV